MYKFGVKNRVRYYHTDTMQVVHHSNYIKWFEDARIEYLRSIGVSLAELIKQGIQSPVVKVECEYKKPGVYDEVITTETWISGFTGARLFFEYSVTGENNAVLALGKSMHTFVKEDFKPVHLKKYNPGIYDVLNEYAQNRS